MILTDPNYSATFDAVVMLTVSHWHTEPRSNRYHYATRFARHSPVIFVQADCKFDGYAFEPSGYPGIEILHVPQEWGGAQTSIIAEALLERRILRPLLWIYSANYVHVAENLFATLRIFHATEDYFSDELKRQLPPGYFDQLRLLFSRLDLLVAVSEGVRDSYVYSGGFRGKTLLLENGCDFSFFRKIVHAMPRSLHPVRPVAFYQGGINDRFDYDLMVELARINPDWDFRLCGVRVDADDKWEDLLSLPNVSYLGVLSPEQIALESAGVTVGLIPFVQTPFIQQKSLPLKAFEYAACGLPVVSVPIDSLNRWPEVFLFASTTAEFGKRMEQARTVRQDPIAMARRLEIAAQQDYDKRFAILMDEVSGLLKVSDNNPKQKLNVLFLYSANSTHTATVQEYLSCFAKFSRHNFLFADAVREVPCFFNLSQFDVIFVHYSVRLTLDDYISSAVVKGLKSCGAYKVLFIQDEYDNTERVHRWMDELGFHAVFSCVPDGQMHKVYPPDRFPSTEFVPILTGYVPHFLEHSRFGFPLRDRPIVLGYRGRRLPFRYGRLCQEKYQIGLQMRAICERQGVACDIEWEEDKRIYGDKWYEFIGNCRAILGSESGSNVFDFDGRLQSVTEVALRQRPNMTFESFHAQFLQGLDGNIRMNQVSPRIFEAIAIGTPLVLFEGDYSGVVHPVEHYIALKKDFSNAQDVLRQLGDIDALQVMADRAWRHVIGSGQYSYKTFVANIDEFLCKRVISVTPWSALLVAIGEIRGDLNDIGRATNVSPARGVAVSWPLPYKSFSDEASSIVSIPAGRESDHNLISARTLLMILARRGAIRILIHVPVKLRRAVKKLMLSIARTLCIISRT